ncbi:putative RNA-directed DNA polymerase from transposon BS [Nephila pilipes]|uniref:Putative RNA-directed DNA polymerase from transposon BS n=1 Tax=Nephila pilipes TaxID=299642 RepID=A0A8X6NF52_NEPPI|nr:putative RNA-directed DNA polymerase from transposon BS [Nephila pilipes]
MSGGRNLLSNFTIIFGIGDKALPYIYDFLRNRTVEDKLSDSMSRGLKLSQGFLQGFILSPPFPLALWGIEDIISRRCEAGLFAADIVPWKSGADISNLENSVNQTLVDMWNCAESHKMCFNPIKSTTIFFTTNRNPSSYQLKFFRNSLFLLVVRYSISIWALFWIRKLSAVSTLTISCLGVEND